MAAAAAMAVRQHRASARGSQKVRGGLCPAMPCASPADWRGDPAQAPVGFKTDESVDSHHYGRMVPTAVRDVTRHGAARALTATSNLARSMVPLTTKEQHHERRNADESVREQIRKRVRLRVVGVYGTRSWWQG